MTPRKRWPNEADWARMDAIALAQRIETMAAPISAGEAMTEIERIQRAHQIETLALKIINCLLAVGPQAFKKETA
ncbi:MAG: hypothetical protein HY867_06275 [Chloroflexi bacterium]|nr:hypothetical protein [Chloroflexota bacterium]